MDELEFHRRFQSFDCKSIPLAENTPATPRPPHRPRMDAPVPTESDGILITFEETFVPAPPGTLASPRPPGRPREIPTPTDPKDEAFAGELADRVQEYVRQRPSGLSAEQLAALIQQILARRSA